MDLEDNRLQEVLVAKQLVDLAVKLPVVSEVRPPVDLVLRQHLVLVLKQHLVLDKIHKVHLEE